MTRSPATPTLWTPDSEGVFDLPWERYQLIRGANCSGIFFPTAAHMRDYANRVLDQISGKEPLTVKPHFVIGTLVHKFLLEPEAAWEGLVIVPSKVAVANWQSDLKQEWYAATLCVERSTFAKPITGDEFKDRAARCGKTVVTPDEFKNIQAMVDAILAKRCRIESSAGRVVFHDRIDRLIALAEAEQAAYSERQATTEDGQAGIPTKCRVDLDVAGNIVLDIKTTAGLATAEDFSRSMMDFRYDARAAFNLDILNSLEPITHVRKEIFMVIAVEKKEPSPEKVAVFQIEPRALDTGRAYYRERLRVWHEAQKAGAWPGYPETVQTIGLPEWAYRKMDKINI